MKNHIFRLLLLMGGILLISQIASQLPAVDAFNQEWIDSHTWNNGMTGVLNFTLVSVFLLSIGLPRQLAAFMGGYAFGFAEGLIYSTLAATLSCAILLLISRCFARPIVTHLLNARVRQVDKFLHHDPLMKSIIIRLLPVGNNLLTNLIAGVSKIKPLPFITGSAIGYLPQMAIFALMGKGVVINSELKISLSILLLGVSGALGAYLLKKYRYRPDEDDVHVVPPQNNMFKFESNECSK